MSSLSVTDKNFTRFSIFQVNIGNKETFSYEISEQINGEIFEPASKSSRNANPKAFNYSIFLLIL